jgi:DNA-binding phage protein
LTESIEIRPSGNIGAGTALLRDIINVTIGFGQLAKAMGTEPKSLIRMFGPSGNPTAKTLLAVIAHLQAEAGASLEVKKERWIAGLVKSC